jgi:preprotein translocase subunit SecA
LVGTTSIEKNEIISEYLKRKKIPHQVLNAKNHEREAAIIAEAGGPQAVTVATNMAGRGVDIVLGGSKDHKNWDELHEKVVKAGGLHVIGTERHEARRVDNQLRGRGGRQGDPGSSSFYLSLEDDLMRIFGGEQISGLMDRLKLPEGQPIENALISKAIEQAQVKVEGFHFDIRKRLVEFDDVANQQRDIIYKLRRRILESKNVKDEVLEKLRKRLSADTLFEIIPFDDVSRKRIETEFEKEGNKEEFLEKILADIYAKREKDLGESMMREVEKYAYLGSIDHLWMDHIDHIDDLREGVSLRGYGQRDPLIEFKNEAFSLFENLVNRIDEELSHRIFRIGVAVPQPEIPLAQARENIDTSDMIGVVEPKSKKIGRNDPCWCKSGKKWKHCHYPQYG